MRLFFIKVLACLMTTGCAVALPQVDSLVKFVEAFQKANPAESSEREVTWLASIGEYGAVLRPYSSNGLTVFANKDGDAIAFDGWTIRSITGFGLKAPLSIAGKDGGRTFLMNKNLKKTYCDAWVLEGRRWNQSCENGPGFILLNESSEIITITMSLAPWLEDVILEVVSEGDDI